MNLKFSEQILMKYMEMNWISNRIVIVVFHCHFNFSLDFFKAWIQYYCLYATASIYVHYSKTLNDRSLSNPFNLFPLNLNFFPSATLRKHWDCRETMSLKLAVYFRTSHQVLNMVILSTYLTELTYSMFQSYALVLIPIKPVRPNSNMNTHVLITDFFTIHVVLRLLGVSIAFNQ